MIIVNRKLTEKMIKATKGFCWTSESQEETVQKMWEAMLDASDCIDLEDNKQNALFEMGKREGIAKIQNGLKDLLDIVDCGCDT